MIKASWGRKALFGCHFHICSSLNEVRTGTHTGQKLMQRHGRVCLLVCLDCFLMESKDHQTRSRITYHGLNPLPSNTNQANVLKAYLQPDLTEAFPWVRFNNRGPDKVRLGFHCKKWGVTSGETRFMLHWYFSMKVMNCHVSTLLFPDSWTVYIEAICRTNPCFHVSFSLS